VTAGTWREALGARERFADWREFFDRALESMSWQELVGHWAGVLLPGGMAVGGHGPVRTAHAIQGLQAAQTPTRMAELAQALAYWAANYQTLPGAVRLTGTLDVTAALQQLPHLSPEQQRSGQPPKVVRLLEPVTEFGRVASSVAAPQDPITALHELSAAGAELYRRHDRYPLVFLHTITAVEAVRTLLPYIPPETHPGAYHFAWHYVAALTAAFGDTTTATPPIDRYPDIDEVLRHCIDSGDEHAFKLTLACLQEYRRRSDPVFLSVADDWSRKMLDARGWERPRRIAAGMAFG
jgi:hypothetical protein